MERLALGVDRHAWRLVSRLRNDYQVQLQFPFRYAKQKPTRFLLSGAGVLALIFTDHRTHEILVPGSGTGDNQLIDPAETLSKWGNASSALPLVLGFGAVGILANSSRERETSVMLFEALLTSATWTELIKKMSGRERPREMEEDVSDWEGPGIFIDDDDDKGLQAFPSGHSTGIWAAATILANQYPKYNIVPIVGYGTAMAMSYSRMVLGAHWLSDVVVGGLIGYGSAKQVLSAHDSKPTPIDNPRFRIGADAWGNYKGLSVRYDF
ncbi:MAG: phosphatase PAP2 family protein [Candidatus Krumholzibacteria bacterium]|nr:phosphatase PAP2 family protein [Candidatus Krumholzibacteria bacterium]